MKKFLKLFALCLAFLGTYSVTHAQTWTPPTGAPPSGVFMAPLNTSSSTQMKAGALGIGESTSTTVGTSGNAYTLEVNGPTATNGLAVVGSAYIGLPQTSTSTPLVHIGPMPATSTYASAYTTATFSSAPSLTYTTGYTGSYTRVTVPGPSVRAPGSTGFALNDSINNSIKNSYTGSFFGNVFGKLKETVASLIDAKPAYAIQNLGWDGTTGTPPPPPIQYGPCYGAWCNSEQYCDSSTKSCENMATTGGSTGGLSDGAVAEAHALPSTAIANLSTSFTGHTSSIATTTVLSVNSGTSVTINYNFSGAASCRIVSSNTEYNWNVTTVTVNSSGIGRGSKTQTFTDPGTYVYTIICTPSGLVLSSNASQSSTVTVIVGPRYVMQVNGNTNFQGYVVADGSVSTQGAFIENGRRVCLQDGTNCPLNSTRNPVYSLKCGSFGPFLSDYGGYGEVGCSSLGALYDTVSAASVTSSHHAKPVGYLDTRYQ